MTRYLLAGGGTAGHVNPLLALADEIMLDKSNSVVALGTKEGLESKLVPERGYKLLTVPRLPMPRRPNIYALKFPFAFRESVKLVKEYLAEQKIDIVVGFGGYASAPAYRAAKDLKIPYVIHEANAMPGYANRIGSKNAAAVAITFSNTKLPKAVLTGMPLRREIVELTKKSKRVEAAKYFDLDAKLPTILVTGGSLGAKRINEVVEAARRDLAAAGIQVIHIVGERAKLPAVVEGGYRRLIYCERMDLALAVADFAISRSGAATVSEFAAVGIPALFVPYPVGNGEQKFNARDMVNSGAAFMVEDQEFSVDYLIDKVIPLLAQPAELAAMKQKALKLGSGAGATNLLKLVNTVVDN